MSVFKCKMCGAALEVDEQTKVVQCDYCGTTQTLPRLDSQQKERLYDRANHLRRSNEYDRAMGIYEQIAQADPADAEAYWSLVLCRYGIEYVEDPATHRRVPTVNRAQFQSVTQDPDYALALKYADSTQTELYTQEAAAIDAIQQGILTISRQEEPFDVFLCYKESDEHGRRTPDSVLAAELYQELTRDGYRVFFSRITLEDKLGTAYEPYIFAALHSARVMVALGTRAAYFQSPWVKNEWGRYLALIKNGEQKTLIPAYRDMDPYDLPEEFAHLQAQDLGKLGAMQDLLHGIGKFVRPAAAQKPQGDAVSVQSLLKRVFLFLRDKEWEQADAYCEKVLDRDPENAQAYLGKLLAAVQVTSPEGLPELDKPFDEVPAYEKALRHGDDRTKALLTGAVRQIKERNEQKRLEEAYQKAADRRELLHSEARPEGKLSLLEELTDALRDCGDYKDAKALLQQAEEEQLELRQKREKAVRKKRFLFAGITAAVLLTAGLGYISVTHVIPAILHNRALASMETGNYEKAITQWDALEQYAYSAKEFPEIQEQTAVALREVGKYDEAIALFQKIDNEAQKNLTVLKKGTHQFEQKQYMDAIETLSVLTADPEAAEILNQAKFALGCVYQNEKDYINAIACFADLADAKENWSECMYRYGMDQLKEKDYETAIEYLAQTDFSDAQEQLQDAYWEAAQFFSKRKAYKTALDYYKKWEKFDEASEFYLENTYQFAVEQKNNLRCQRAIREFEKILDYSDSKDQILQCKLEYAMLPSSDKYIAEEYLEELIELEYPNAEACYQELFAWRVTDIIANNDSENDTTSMTSISIFDPVFFHFTLAGGPPSGSTIITVKANYPNGSHTEYTWDYEIGSGSGYWYGWESGLYKGPYIYNGARGKLSVQFYDGKGNEIGSASVNMVS